MLFIYLHGTECQGGQRQTMNVKSGFDKNIMLQTKAELFLKG